MKNQLKTMMLLGVLSAVLIGVGGLLGQGYLLGFGVIALLMNLGAYFFSDRVVLRLHRARKIEPQDAPGLFRLTADLAARAGIPAPRLYLIDDPHANAFATGRNPDHGVVAVTTGLLATLNQAEVRGVVAHEIAHIKNRDILVATIAATMAAVVTYLGHALTFAGLLGGRSDDDDGVGAGGLVMAIVAPIVATMLQMAVSRSREYLADETAAQLTGAPRDLASALSRLERRAAELPGAPVPATASLFIVSPFAGGRSVANLFSTHPPMELRIRRLLELERSGHTA